MRDLLGDSWLARKSQNFTSYNRRPRRKLRPWALLCPMMAIATGGLSCDRLYGAGLEASHLRSENNRAGTRLSPCCMYVEQRIMKRIEAADSNVSAPFTGGSLPSKTTWHTPLCH
ncbi:hypothetical protein M9H77_25978 [Catharanthus roseus]|uniref:Uncharacterized protein n=1 Tax=Catharanthus roseus TaxID=4058 RepID=A0ACC0AA85_CATRO|nr:hypothetical protein M9H77_25978 [Catharanthus roseus]